MIRRLEIAACIAMATAAIVGDAVDCMAQTNAVQTGNWSTPATWSGGEPTDLVPAGIAGGFTVTIDQVNEVTNLLGVGSVAGQTGNLSITGGNLTITDTDTITAPNTPSLAVGAVAGATGVLTMSGGQVFVGDAAGSGIGNGELLVGNGGNGTMNQSGGTFQAADEIFIGLGGTGVGTVNVSGGTFEALGRSILVGFQGGNGTLNVTGTGDVNANFDMLVGFLPGSTATINLADSGTIDAGFLFTNFAAGPGGSTVNMTQTGGTYTARIAYVLGQGPGTTNMTHSGGLINVPTGPGDMVVSDGGGNTSTYNISGTASVTLLRSFIVGAFGGSNGTVNQTGGTITAGGGPAPEGRDGLLIGRDGDGVWNMSGGTNTATNVFLGDFDSSNGTMNISGGTLNVTGNLNVGAAIASNAVNVALPGPPPIPVRGEPGQTDPQGQALDANGIFNVIGTGGAINVAGNLLANPRDKGAARNDPGEENDSTLRFTLGATGISMIDVTLKADLDGAVIDINDTLGFFTTNPAASLTLIDAAAGFGNVYTLTANEAFVGPAGAGKNFSLAPGDASQFSLQILPSGPGEKLVLTKLAAGNDADFDNDGDVDGADFLTWQRGLGLTGAAATNMAGNANGDMVINGADLTVWRNNFGLPAVPAVGAVPEPSAALLLCVGLAALAVRRRS